MVGFSRFGAGSDRQDLKTEIFSNSMLQVDYIIAFLQIRKIDVQRGTSRLGPRRSHPPGALDLVAAEDLSVSDYDNFCLNTNTPAGKRADLDLRATLSACSIHG